MYLDALENQLKALLKSMDVVVSQRKALAEAAGDFSASLQSLSVVELSPSLSIPLAGLSDLQIRVKNCTNDKRSRMFLHLVSLLMSIFD